MTISEFLFKKFNEYSLPETIDFVSSFTKNLPTSCNPADAYTNNNYATWGYSDDGFWVVSDLKAYLYQNDGTIHLISFDFDKEQFDRYKKLQQSGLFRTAIPVSIEELAITVNGHPSYNSAGTPVWYVKFTAPSGVLGIPSSVWVMLDENINPGNGFRKIVDLTTDLLKALKELELPAPQKVGSPGKTSNMFSQFFKDDEGVYLVDCLFKDDIDYNTLISNIWETVISKNAENSDAVLVYARSKWQQFTI